MSAKLKKVILEINGTTMEANFATKEEIRGLIKEGFDLVCDCGLQVCHNTYVYVCAEYDGSCVWFRSDVRCNEELTEITDGELSEDDRNIPEVKIEYTHYSDARYVRWAGDKLIGRWSTSMADTCNGSIFENFIYKNQIIKGPSAAGNCNGIEVIKVKNIV